MNDHSINFEKLLDADGLNASRQCPWTFFAYPTSLALPNGLPPDSEACQLLGEIQSRGVYVAIWVSEATENTTYFACNHEDRERLDEILKELESAEHLEQDFLAQHSERLFSGLNRGT